MADKPAPKVGHFLPGGEGDATGQASSPAEAGGSAPLTAPTPRLGGEAPPTPPQLTGSRIDSRRTTTSGTRLGPPTPDDPAAAAYRAVFDPEPIPFVPKKRSKALVAAIVVGALVLVAGGVAFAAKVLSSYDDIVANPMGTPSIRPSDEPSTTEPVGKGTPDPDVVGKNPIYSAGKMPVVACKEPVYRPTSKENVRSYYQALIACMDKAWEPIVTKAGFEFRTPRLIIFDQGEETACGVQDEDISSYCADEQGGSVTMPWQELTEKYPKNKAQYRASMAQALGFVYGAHIQNLTGIFDASANLHDTAATKAGELEQDRRAALQANCFSAVFFGAAKASFPLRGELLNQWSWLVQHAGDEYAKDKVRDHGSSKNVTYWMNRGFAGSDLATCNTFVAPSATVS